MLRFKLLRNLLILSLAIAFLLPSYEYLFVHPAYNDLLTEVTENDAVRFANYLVRAVGMEGQRLTKDHLPEELGKSLQPENRDKLLVKLRIFSEHGEIIFSTQPEEVGVLNKNSYFHEIVAKGKVYSKVVKKDRSTAEGVVAQIDIVETYVPFMVGEAFGGAIEVYYDITKSVGRISTLSVRSMATIWAMSLGLLLAILLALYRAYYSFLERDAAEAALLKANEELEGRVDERTRELTDANEQLTEQIAERTQAQIALSQALEEIKLDREKLDGILSSVPDGVVVTDGGLNIRHMNAAAEEILGTPLNEVLGQSVSHLRDDVGFLKKIGQRLNVVDRSRSFDFELPGIDSAHTRVYQVRISQLVSDETESPGVVLLLRDVTREREIERMKSAFLGMAAHELNTPLTTIIGYSELLTSEETAGNFDADQKKDFIALIHNKALALGGLIDDLLDVSRVESGRPLTLCYEALLFDDMINKVVDSLRERQTAHTFEVSLPAEATSLYADHRRLEQVVSHLLSNAVKYSPEGGCIKVALVSSGDTCEFSVEDQGIGMNELELAHIFDHFYRADSSDTAAQGVGLGMSIVRNIVLAHYGDIQVDSEIGRGTRICVTLPITPRVAYAEGHQPFAAS